MQMILLIRDFFSSVRMRFCVRGLDRFWIIFHKLWSGIHYSSSRFGDVLTFYLVGPSHQFSSSSNILFIQHIYIKIKIISSHADTVIQAFLLSHRDYCHSLDTCVTRKYIS